MKETAIGNPGDTSQCPRNVPFTESTFIAFVVQQQRVFCQFENPGNSTTFKGSLAMLFSVESSSSVICELKTPKFL